MSKLVIVGTVAFDAIETPFGKTDKILGGAATFIGLAASQFQVDGAIVSVVGGDFPRSYIDMLSQRGLDVDGLEIVPNAFDIECPRPRPISSKAERALTALRQGNRIE